MAEKLWGIDSVLIFIGGARDKGGSYHNVQNAYEKYKKNNTFGAAKLYYDTWPSATGWSKRAVELVNSQPLGKKIALIGHSLGGGGAYLTALKANRRIRYLATIDAVGPISQWVCQVKPPHVMYWRNVVVVGSFGFSDLVAVGGGHWGVRFGAKNQMAPKGTSHASFATMVAPLIPEINFAMDNE